MTGVNGKLGEVGYGIAEEPVIVRPNGDFSMTSGKLEFDVIGCRHCGKVIQILVMDSRATTKYECRKCNGPICKYCAEKRDGGNGSCYPLMAQVEFHQRHGVLPHEVGILDYRAVRRLER